MNKIIIKISSNDAKIEFGVLILIICMKAVNILLVTVVSGIQG